MSHSTTTPTATRTFITAPDTASIFSLASTISVDWEEEKRGNTYPAAAATAPVSATVESGGEAATKTGSLIIRNLFIIGFLIPVAWIIAIFKVFILDGSHSSPPLTAPATLAGGGTDIEANTPSGEEKYSEGRYWAYLCMAGGVVYIACGLTIVWILCVEKQRLGV